MLRSARRVLFEHLEQRQLLHGGDVVASVAAAEVADEGEGEGLPVYDFSLVDLNVNSATFNQSVSPRDYKGQVSAWYFGSAT